jgi:hypothetical protein
VRHHVVIQETLVLPETLKRRGIAVLSAIVGTLMDRPEALDVVVEQLAPQADLDTTLALRASRQIEAELQQTEQSATSRAA